MVMQQGDGLVSLKEINDLLQLPQSRVYLLMKKGVFQAHKIGKHYAVTEQMLAYVIDRINRYEQKAPFNPGDNITIDEAARLLGVKNHSIYQMVVMGNLEWALDELWKMPTRASVNRVLSRRGQLAI